MIKAIIFDLDGVIVSTDDFHYMAWKQIALEQGIYFDKTINHRLRGVSRMESLEIILSNSNRSYTMEEKLSLAKEKNDYYVSLLGQLSKKDILPRVISTLKWLKHRNYKIAIGSSSKNAKTILQKLDILEWFDVIVDGNDLSFSKPHPQVFNLAAERLHLSSVDCAVVEDAEAGIEAAKSANMIVFGMGEASKYAKTDHPIQFIDEIIPHLTTRSKTPLS